MMLNMMELWVETVNRKACIELMSKLNIESEYFRPNRQKNVAIIAKLCFMLLYRKILLQSHKMNKKI